MAIEEITQTPTRLGASAALAKVENTGFSKESLAANTKKLDGPDAVGSSEYSFWDFLDIINPLQHIPVVNTIYREVTGDTIKPEMKIAGGTALGGVFGLVSSLADVIFEQETGKDIGSTVVASVLGDEKAAPTQTAALENVPNAPIPVSLERIQTDAAMLAPLPAKLPLPAANDRRDDKSEHRDRLSYIDPMDQHVLELYGKSNPVAASKAYQQADMRSYLQQASLTSTF